ncbi:MAG: hypothetical protein ABI150_04185, partial [Nitrobacter sp.]
MTQLGPPAKSASSEVRSSSRQTSNHPCSRSANNAFVLFQIGDFNEVHLALENIADLDLTIRREV